MIGIKRRRLGKLIFDTLSKTRALNQAMGRCIRHTYDYDAIMFLDERFQVLFDHIGLFI